MGAQSEGLTGHMMRGVGTERSESHSDQLNLRFLGDILDEQQKLVNRWTWAWQAASNEQRRPPMENINQQPEKWNLGEGMNQESRWGMEVCQREK